MIYAAFAAAQAVHPAVFPGLEEAAAIIHPFSRWNMEAERINQIVSTLAGLDARAAELRRYL
jgi:hypothetical protein